MKATVKDRGERLDRVARATLGTEQNGASEAVLAANPGLGRKMVMSPDASLPAGTEINSPADFKAVASETFVLAWE